jgi:hypothetical protein
VNESTFQPASIFQIILFRYFSTAQESFDQALAVLESGKVYKSLMKWLEEAKK